MQIRTLIFDLDGTLIDSSDGVVEAVNYAFRSLGLPEQSPSRIKPYIGYPLKEMFADMTDASVDELCRHFQSKAISCVVDSSTVLPGVEPVLRELYARGYQMAIATTKIKAHVDAIVAKFGWQRYFDALVAGNEVGQVKPHPEAICLSLNRLHASAESAIVIGDTENDIRAAQGVPTRVAAVLSPYGGEEKLRALHPDFILTHLSELVPILDGISTPTRDS